MAAAIALLAVPLPGIYAQESTAKGVTVSPSFKELIIGPGLVEAKTSITVRNDTGKDLTGRIRLVDFDALGEFGGITFTEDGTMATQYGLAKWMSLPDGDTVQLPNGKNVEVPITIRNDDGLTPGGHYGAAIVTVSGDQNLSSDKLVFKQELASLFFVKKTGGETYGLELESFNAENLPSITSDITMKFKSTGNVHVVPRGYIEVTDPRGIVVSKGIINPESTLALPGKSRQFKTTMQQIAKPRLWGTYTINVYYRYDGKDGFDKQTLTFKRGIINVSTGIILLAGIIITGVITFFFKKKRGYKVK